MWTAAGAPSWGQQAARVGPWRSEQTHLAIEMPDRTGRRAVVEALRLSRSAPGLEQPAALPVGIPDLTPALEPRLSRREPFGRAGDTDQLLDNWRRWTAREGSLPLLVRTPLRFLDAPGRALSRLTGADKASLNPLKKRISFTWYVNLL